ncbi:unnamed protein product [Prunus armeniaca]|uniref:Uncharacterized protein n=1 Tax=Prunus armeniaca TaxID=36596 RepID=A0A6J5XY08_PRUAR|nr:unnamed protein product [Prunus armeniaca]
MGNGSVRGDISSLYNLANICFRTDFELPRNENLWKLHCQTNNLTSGFSLNQEFFFTGSNCLPVLQLNAIDLYQMKLWGEEAESVELQSNFFFLYRENVL